MESPERGGIHVRNGTPRGRIQLPVLYEGLQLRYEPIIQCKLVLPNLIEIRSFLFGDKLMYVPSPIKISTLNMFGTGRTLNECYDKISCFQASEDGGKTVLRNDGIQPPHYTTSQP